MCHTLNGNYIQLQVIQEQQSGYLRITFLSQSPTPGAFVVESQSSSVAKKGADSLASGGSSLELLGSRLPFLLRWRHGVI